MQDSFRLALLGAGMITQGSHLPAALESHRIKVAALVDPAPDRARRLAQSCGINPIIAESVDDVFDSVDGVLIATPNGSHRELAVRCLDGGVLMVTATHFLDRILHFWGTPHDVEYEDDSEGGPEANCIARFAYRSGAHAFSGVAVYSKTCSLPGGMVIETERGQVKLADSDDAQIAFVPNDPTRHRANHPAGRRAAARPFDIRVSLATRILCDCLRRWRQADGRCERRDRIGAIDRTPLWSA